MSVKQINYCKNYVTFFNAIIYCRILFLPAHCITFNSSVIIIFVSKFTEKLGFLINIVLLLEDKSSIADGGALKYG